MIKTLVAGAFVRRPGYWAAARRRRAMASLCYHRVCDDVDPLGLAVSETEFAQQMQALAASSRLVAVNADQFHALWCGQHAYEGRVPVLVSFDDGFRDNLEVAAPILRHYGIPAILFVATDVLAGKPLWYDKVERMFEAGHAGELQDAFGRLGVRPNMPAAGAAQWVESIRKLQSAVFVKAMAVIAGMAPGLDLSGRYLSADDLGRWASLGLEVGAHSCSHPRLTALDAEAALQEMTRSRQVIGESLGQAVDFFAYPFGERGDFDSGHCRALASAGYRMAFTTIQGGNRAGGDPFTVRRKCVMSGLFAGPGGAFSETLFLADVMGLGADLKNRLGVGGKRTRASA